MLESKVLHDYRFPSWAGRNVPKNKALREKGLEE